MSSLVAEQAKPEPAPVPLGLYVHVPFCASTCDFCAFYQTSPTAAGVRLFLDGVAREAELVHWNRPVATVFWGGGTPGLLAPRDLEKLGALVRARLGDGGGVSSCGAAPFGNVGGVPSPRGSDLVLPQRGGATAPPLAKPIEWSVELAPGSVTEARLAVLKAAGVTRISMGAQSFQPALLDALGRKHTREQIFRAYDRIRAAGFASVNLDLMFALPGQSSEEWAADVREAVALAPDHISTYCLTFEEDTKLWVKLSQGRVKLDPEHEAALYEATWDQLGAAGYAQYEISNFARPGHACHHNLNTWRMHEWVGLGPSGASQYDGWRGANVSDLDQWAAGLTRGERMTDDRVALTPALLAEDALIFGLRMNAGVDVGAWKQRAPEAPWACVEDMLATLAANGFLEQQGTIVRLTKRGRLVADSVGAEIMAAFEPITETA